MGSKKCQVRDRRWASAPERAAEVLVGVVPVPVGAEGVRAVASQRVSPEPPCAGPLGAGVEALDYVTVSSVHSHPSQREGRPWRADALGTAAAAQLTADSRGRQTASRPRREQLRAAQTAARAPIWRPCRP